MFPSLFTAKSVPVVLQIYWDASPEQKKQCLNKGRDNQVLGYLYSTFITFPIIQPFVLL